MTTYQTYLQDEPLWVKRIHAYWFGLEDVYAEGYKHNFRLWYRGGPRVDEEIRTLFGPLLCELKEADDATREEHYLTSPRASLAAVILLDQMSRNMYRGDARMFETDALAQGIVRQLLGSGGYHTLAAIERLFLCVALEHAEDLETVQLSATLMEALADQAPAPQKKRFVSMCTYNQQHLDIIERFGRYPHRNPLLGRETTEAEAAFLQEKRYRFMRSVKKGYK